MLKQFVWYRLAAARGDADAQYSLGLMYQNGTGVTQDYAAALRWYRLAAAQDSANAQYNLGVMYFNGNGVAQDNAQAYKWFKLSSASGNKDAMKNRDAVATKMSPQKIAEAKKLAREFHARGFGSFA